MTAHDHMTAHDRTWLGPPNSCQAQLFSSESTLTLCWCHVGISLQLFLKCCHFIAWEFIPFFFRNIRHKESTLLWKILHVCRVFSTYCLLRQSIFLDVIRNVCLGGGWLKIFIWTFHREPWPIWNNFYFYNSSWADSSQETDMTHSSEIKCSKASCTFLYM